MPHEWRPGRAKDPQAWHVDIGAEGIGDEIDRVAEVEKRPDAVILAEWRPPRLEEGLGSNHQNPHSALWRL